MQFCRVYFVRPRRCDYAVLALGSLSYSVILGAAAVRAVWRQARGQRGREKTSHTGFHRTDQAWTTSPATMPAARGVG